MIHWFIGLAVYSLFHWFIGVGSLVHWLFGLFVFLVYWFIHWFIHPSFHPFIHSFIYSFIHSLDHWLMIILYRTVGCLVKTVNYLCSTVYTNSTAASRNIIFDFMFDRLRAVRHVVNQSINQFMSESFFVSSLLDNWFAYCLISM